MSETCPQCHDLGWVLEGDASKSPLALELLPCLLPDCEASGRDIEILSLNEGRFTTVRMTPSYPNWGFPTGFMMSVGR